MMEKIRFKHYIAISFFAHLTLLGIMQVNINQDIRFKPIDVRIVDIPSSLLPKEDILPRYPVLPELRDKSPTSKHRADKKQSLADASLLSPQRYEDISARKEGHPKESQDLLGTQQESQKPFSDLTSPKKWIEKLPLVTKNDIERLAKKYTPPAKPEESKRDITLDTDEFKYLSYLQKLKYRIEYAWKYPDDAKIKGIDGDLYIRFSILKDGALGEVLLLRSSGYKSLDEAALKALNDSNPFWPLPDSWKENELTITGHFIYYLGNLYLR